MIGYVTLGTNDLPRAVAFFDALLPLVGATRMMEGENFVAWEGPNNGPGIGVTKPFDGKPASVGNGTMVALMVDSPEQARAVHAKALSLGAKDEGAPGMRGGGFYCAYFRDLDGNKFNAFCMGVEQP